MEEKKNKKPGSGNGEDNDILEQIKEGKKRLEKKGEKTDDPVIDSEMDELKEEIEVLRKELSHYKKVEDDYLDKLQRIHADYDNFRKRTLREQAETINKANKNLIEKLLPVIDSFDHALETMKNQIGKNDEFRKGVEMIFEKLMDTLKKEGLIVIDPKGEEFNPYLCEAAVTESVADVEEGVVLEVLRKGYKLNDLLIRPAVVKVCKKVDK